MKPMMIAVFSLNPATSNVPALESSCRLIRALARIGHQVTFYHPDFVDRRTLWEGAKIEGVRTVHYPTRGYVGLFECLEEAAQSDILIKMTNAGPFDRMLDQAVLEIRKPASLTVLLDLDPRSTLTRIQHEIEHSLLNLIPEYGLVLTADGGQQALGTYQALGVRAYAQLWSTLDPVTRQISPPPPQAAARKEVTLDHVMALENALGQCLRDGGLRTAAHVA